MEQARATARLLSFVLLALAACSGRSGGRPDIDGKAALGNAAKLVAFGPRPSGSDALRKTGDWILGELGALGLQTKTDEWEEKGIKFRNLWAELPGSDERIIILAAHYDTKKFEGHANPSFNFRFVGANDGASGTALLLELAKRLKTPSPAPPAGAGRKATLWIVFFDGEECLDPAEWKDDNALFGSRRFAGRVAKEWFGNGEYQRRVRGLILLDMVGAVDLKLDLDRLSSPEPLAIFKEAAKQLGHEQRFFQKPSGYTDDHMPFQKLGIPVIDLIDLDDRQPTGAGGAQPGRWWHTAADDIGILSADSLQIVGETVLVALPLWEQRFLK